MEQRLSVSEIDRLYIQGDRDLHQGKFKPAIAIFEKLLATIEPQERLYFDVQRSLIKAYQQNQELDKAISLCQLVAASEIASTALWGQNFLVALSPESFTPPQTETEAPTPKQPAAPKTKPKTLAEFKQFCQDNLLAELKTLESKRKYTLKTILGSAIICLILPYFSVWVLSFWIRINNPLPFYWLCGIILIPIWITFCQGAIYSYKVGFKRNIIETIVDFLSDGDRQLNYAAHLFIENKRQTIEALTRSQIIRNKLREPDYLEQEDCVYGNIGETEIFFAEIFAEDRQGAHRDEYGREVYRNKQTLFHGLFFEAKFAKSFVCRTFIVPNNAWGRIPSLNSWRGEVIKLEDPEFARLFCVYGDSQIESRYILSTNLMNRLVKFNQKAKRIQISFVDGFLYVAIPYRYRLFEPRLFNSMMSFAPLKEYFLDLQLMIDIVEDLNLNRRIWK